MLGTMRRKILLLLIINLFFLNIVNAETKSKDEIVPLTYVIGNYMFTRTQNDNYNGKLTTQGIMLASKTINSNKESDMIIYYKKSNGDWINALTGASINPPENFEIETINLRN